jgi:hypothetical protein
VSKLDCSPPVDVLRDRLRLLFAPPLSLPPRRLEATTATPDASSATVEATVATRFTALRVLRVAFLVADGFRDDALRLPPRLDVALFLEPLRRLDVFVPRRFDDARDFFDDARPLLAADDFRLLPLLPLLLFRAPDLRAAIIDLPCWRLTPYAH